MASRSKRKAAAARRSGIGAALLLAVGLVLAVAGVSLAAEQFVPGTEDLPLMPGLTAIDGAGVIFDTPQGRIVEAYATGAAKDKDILDFYAETLPQLGWTAVTSTAYRREGETLRLELYRKTGKITVRFYLSPG